jgi:hypothetical protein
MFTRVYMANIGLTSGSRHRYCIKPSGFRPVYVSFMHVWAGITGIRVSFVREGELSRTWGACASSGPSLYHGSIGVIGGDTDEDP